jgi:hypothetical protein
MTTKQSVKDVEVGGDILQKIGKGGIDDSEQSVEQGKIKGSINQSSNADGIVIGGGRIIGTGVKAIVAIAIIVVLYLVWQVFG